MTKLFTFAPLKRNDEVKAINVWFIDFAGGHAVKYNAPTWKGVFELPCGDNFFYNKILDGGGFVEVTYIDGTEERIYPICTMCKSDHIEHTYDKENHIYIHKCQTCNTII